MGFADMDEVLTKFLYRENSGRVALSGVKSITIPKLEPREASPHETARILIDFERKEISALQSKYPDFAAFYGKRALKLLDSVSLGEAQNSGRREADFDAVAGLLWCALGSDEKATPFLERAYDSGSPRANVYLQLAQIRMGKLGQMDHSISEQSADFILGPIRTHPDCLRDRRAIALLLQVLSRSNVKNGDFALLFRAINYFPRDNTLISQIAELARMTHLEPQSIAEVERAYDSPLLKRPKAELLGLMAGVSSKTGRSN